MIIIMIIIYRGLEMFKKHPKPSYLSDGLRVLGLGFRVLVGWGVGGCSFGGFRV